MKFKQYLNEGRSKSISEDEAVDLVIKNCSKHFKSIYMSGKTMPIYRGIKDSTDYNYIDSNKGKPRTSTNTENYMTWLMDNLPSWKNYPKRSRGIICSTNVDYAYDYGRACHVIPYNDAKIAVCPNNDVWFSFTKVLKGNTVNLFNNNLYSNFIRFKSVTGGNPTSWIKFKKALQAIDNEFKAQYNDGNKNVYDWYNQYGIFKPNKDVMDTLNTILTPLKNGFRLGVKNLQTNREVWIQGKAILVFENKANEFIEKVIDEI